MWQSWTVCCVELLALQQSLILCLKEKLNFNKKKPPIEANQNKKIKVKITRT